MCKKICRDYVEPGTTLSGTGNYVSKTDCTVHTDIMEGALSLFKRGMKGVYQHCGEQHLHRYLAEFEFRYNTRIANGFDDCAALSKRGFRVSSASGSPTTSPHEDYGWSLSRVSR